MHSRLLLVFLLGLQAAAPAQIDHSARPQADALARAHGVAAFASAEAWEFELEMVVEARQLWRGTFTMTPDARLLRLERGDGVRIGRNGSGPVWMQPAHARVDDPAAELESLSFLLAAPLRVSGTSSTLALRPFTPAGRSTTWELHLEESTRTGWLPAPTVLVFLNRTTNQINHLAWTEPLPRRFPIAGVNAVVFAKPYASEGFSYPSELVLTTWGPTQGIGRARGALHVRRVRSVGNIAD